MTRDVFSRSRPAEDAAAPSANVQVSAQLSLFIETAAVSIAFSIKGSAQDVTEPALPAAPDLTGPGVEDDPLADGVAGQVQADIAGIAGALVAQARPEQPVTDDSEPGDESAGINWHAFGEFPEDMGGTRQDEEENEPVPEEPAQSGSSAGFAPQLDQPEFFGDESDDESQPVEGDGEADTSPDKQRALLSAEGKAALSFDDVADGFALPDAGLGPAAIAGPGAVAGLEPGGWSGVRIPDSVTELSRGNHGRHQVALTFDDGPHPEYTEQILSILSYYDVPATFFFVGIQCAKHPDLVQQAYRRGDEIGSQTYDHFRLPNLPVEEKEYQIDEYQLLIKRLCGAEPRFLRPPGGQVDDQTKALLKERGMVLGLWDVALNDTKDGKTAEEMLATARDQIRPGSVILAHSGVKATVELLPQLIEELRRRGYEFVTMSQLAADL